MQPRTYLDQRKRGLAHGEPLAHTQAAADRMRRVNPGLPRSRAEALAARQTEAVEGGRQWAWDARHRGRSPRPFDEKHFVRFLREITCPTLAVRGGRSRYPGFERAAHLSNVRTLVLPDAGHLVHHDAPEALTAAVRAHLS